MSRIISLLSIATATVVFNPNSVDAFCCSSSSGSNSTWKQFCHGIGSAVRSLRTSKTSPSPNPSNFDVPKTDKFIAIYFTLYEKLHGCTPNAVPLLWTADFWKAIQSLDYYDGNIVFVGHGECGSEKLSLWCDEWGREWVSSKSSIAKSWADNNPDVDIDFFTDVEDELSKVCGITFRLYILGEVKGRCAYSDPKEKAMIETLEGLLSRELNRALAALNKSLKRKRAEAKKSRDSSSSSV